MTDSLPPELSRSSDPSSLWSVWGRGLVLMATLLAIGLLVNRLGFSSMLETQWVDSHIRGQGMTGSLLFIVTGAAFTAIGLPRQVVSFLAGYAFGFIPGTIESLLATLVGAVGVFYYARFMGRDFLVRRFPHKIKKVDDFLVENTLAMALVLRLSPFTNNLATNLAAGVSAVRPIPFFSGSVLGYLPQAAIFALLGSGVNLEGELRTALSVVLLITSSALGWWLWRRYRLETK